jgi:hypothetical protein
MLRKLLVSVAHYVLGPFGSDSDLSVRFNCTADVECAKLSVSA